MKTTIEQALSVEQRLTRIEDNQRWTYILLAVIAVGTYASPWVRPVLAGIVGGG